MVYIIEKKRERENCKAAQLVFRAYFTPCCQVTLIRDFVVGVREREKTVGSDFPVGE